MERDGPLFIGLELIDSHNDSPFRLDGALVLISGFLDLALHPACLDRRKHAAEPIDHIQAFEGLTLNRVCDPLDGFSAAHGIYRIRDSGFPGDYLLRS